MRERVVEIGRPVPLHGVVCEPGDFDASRPAIIIFNSGLMHHIGSCRLSVKLARMLAEDGLFSLRFDFAGIGDSEGRQVSGPPLSSLLGQTREVLDFVQQRWGIKTFILYGLCSGADISYHAALEDDRVVAISQIDPYCYRTTRYFYWLARRKIVNVRLWPYYFRRLIEVVGGRISQLISSKRGDGDEDELYETRIFPPKREVEQGLAQLLERGLQFNINVTGDEPAYSYLNQYRESFSTLDFGDKLELHYWQDASHIITHPEHQRVALSTIRNWCNSVAGNGR